MNAKRAKMFRQIAREFGFKQPHLQKKVVHTANKIGIRSAYAFAQFCDKVAEELEERMKETLNGRSESDS